jgi:anti-sigma B factor antagonist
MHVEVRSAGDVVIVDLVGKLSAGLGDQILRESIDELLAEGKKKILLNLSGVSFLDSAGIGELVSGLRTAERLGAELRLLSASSKVHSTLQVARLLPVFKTYDDEKTALKDFFDSPGPA